MVRQKKYVDLCLLIKTSNNIEPIYCHKFIVCESSATIEMLYRNKSEQAIKNTTYWPPVNTIDILLPDTIEINSFRNAIKFMYDEELDPTVKTTDLINAMIYLLINETQIFNLIAFHIPPDDPTKLTIDHINCLRKYIETYGINNNSELNKKGSAIIGYFGKTLANHVIGSTSDMDLFDAKPIINRSSSNYFWKSYIFNYLNNVYNFEVFGINWIIKFSNHKNCYYIELYVNEDSVENAPFSLEISLIIYTQDKIRKINKKIPIFLSSKNKKSYYLFDTNSNIIDSYDKNKINFYFMSTCCCEPKFSLLMEKVSTE